MISLHCGLSDAFVQFVAKWLSIHPPIWIRSITPRGIWILRFRNLEWNPIPLHLYVVPFPSVKELLLVGLSKENPHLWDGYNLVVGIVDGPMTAELGAPERSGLRGCAQPCAPVAQNPQPCGGILSASISSFRDQS